MELLTKGFWSLILVLLLVTWGDAGFLQHKVKVHIINDIGQGSVDLTVHCKSKNDDLGNRVISYQGSWEFQFRPNVMGTTQFFCSMAWKDEFRWFDIFVYDRDYPNCYFCQWSIKPDGPCRFNSATNKFDTCFKWNIE